MSDALGVREAVERDARARCAAGDIAGATTAALEAYGPEILGFLVTVLRDEEAARDVFADVSEQIFNGLASFQWRSSLRTWTYVVARRTLWRFQQQDRRRRRDVPLSGAQAVSQIADRVATRTLEFLRTEVKDRVTRLRDELEPEDRQLLILRTSRKLSWAEIAEILDDGRAGEKELARSAAALRKRFQRLVEQLRERMKSEGLLPE